MRHVGQGWVNDWAYESLADERLFFHGRGIRVNIFQLQGGVGVVPGLKGRPSFFSMLERIQATSLVD